MMRKDLYMIALVRQVYKENMLAQTVVQQRYDHNYTIFHHAKELNKSSFFAGCGDGILKYFLIYY